MTNGVSGRAKTGRRGGLTLLELVVVVAVLAILAGFIIPLAGGQIERSKRVATNANLVLIRDAIMGTADKPGFYSDTGLLPGTLTDLFINPFPTTDPLYTFNRDTGRGWRGPYIVSQAGQYTVNNATNFFAYTNGTGGYPGSGYGLNGEPAILDAWGRPIVLQISNQSATFAAPYPTALAADLQFARLISAGPNGTIDTPPNVTDFNGNPYPVTGNRGDDIVLFVQHSDSNP